MNILVARIAFCVFCRSVILQRRKNRILRFPRINTVSFRKFPRARQQFHSAFSAKMQTFFYEFVKGTHINKNKNYFLQHLL